MKQVLPIDAHSQEIVSTLRQGKNFVLSAPTGTGKTTRVPQMFFHNFPHSRILIVEPRRVACRAAARRICEELCVLLGEEVGYVTRFESKISQATRICFVTDGILIQRLMKDRLLRSEDFVVFDEFHERRILMDLGLALLRQAQSIRKNLRLIVMSATLSEKDRLGLFLDAHVLETHDPGFPVELFYLASRPKEESISKVIALEVAKLHAAKATGDILVFLPGKSEIAETFREITAQKIHDLSVLILHGELPAREQDRVFERLPTRRVILSTNIAETSLTIPGVRFVIDSGLARISRFDPDLGVDALCVQPIAQDAATQRAARAGREAPGICLRLWSKRDQEQLEKTTTSEIRRVDLTDLVLRLTALAVKDIASFDFFEPPNSDRLQGAERLLQMLGCLDKHRRLNHIGQATMKFSLPVRFSRMMLEAIQQGCVSEIATIAAMLSGRLVFMQKDETFAVSSVADYETLIKVYDRFRQKGFSRSWCAQNGFNYQALEEARRVRKQIIAQAVRLGGEENTQVASRVSLNRALLAGLLDRVGKRTKEGMYDLATGIRASITKESLVSSDLIVAGNVHSSSWPIRERTVSRISMAFEISEEELRQAAPHLFKEKVEVLEVFPALDKVRVEMTERYLALVIRKKTAGFVSMNQARELGIEPSRLSSAIGNELEETRSLVDELLGE